MNGENITTTLSLRLSKMHDEKLEELVEMIPGETKASIARNLLQRAILDLRGEVDHNSTAYANRQAFKHAAGLQNGGSK